MPEQDDQNPQETPPTQDTPPQETPPQETPSNGPTEGKDNYTALLEAALREKNAELQRAQLQLERYQQQPPQPAQQVTPEEERTAFFNEPRKEIRKVVKELLDESIAPLQDIAKMFRSNTAFERVKAQFMQDPRFSQLLSDPKVGIAVEKMLEGQEVTPQLFQGALIQIAGLKATGQLDAALVASGVNVQQFNSAPPPPPQPPSPVNTPPHMRPTPPPAPSGFAPQAKKREYTENERRLMREMNLTEEQYDAWMNESPASVVNSKIGKPNNG